MSSLGHQRWLPVELGSSWSIGLDGSACKMGKPKLKLLNFVMLIKIIGIENIIFELVAQQGCRGVLDSLLFKVGTMAVHYESERRA